MKAIRCFVGFLIVERMVLERKCYILELRCKSQSPGIALGFKRGFWGGNTEFGALRGWLFGIFRMLSESSWHKLIML